MSTNYIILLPPSEGKNAGGKETFNWLKKLSFINLYELRQKILAHVEKEFALVNNKNVFTKLEKLLHVKDKNVHKAIELNKNLTQDQTECLPAIERFAGVMFHAIGFADLQSEQKKNFNEATLFVDGLFGLLRPQDKIPNYKFPLSSSRVSNIKIDSFWKDFLCDTLVKRCKNKLVIDLLPQAHKKALCDDIKNQCINVSFCIKKSGKLVQAGHASKELKGEFIQYMVQKNNIDISYLSKFEHSKGYKYSKHYSSDEKIVFML